MKLNTKLLVSLLGAVAMISSLNAIQIDSQTIHLINASSARVADVNAPNEDEIARDILDEQNEENRENIAHREQPVKALAGTEDKEEDEEITNDYSNVMAAYYSTTHRAAYHKAINVSSDGLNIELEDKSIWEVHGWDTAKLKRWNLTHTIVIAPNKNIFTKGSYPYKLINLDTKEVAKAKMKFTPVLNDPNVDIYVHWIEDIDYIKGLIRLEDGSLWNIPWSDKNMLQHFNRYNIVIVGTNDGWFRGTCPNILICVKNNAYIRGIVVN